mmetsp:Transcript_8401/g.25008  ORF Transcript_8401/g.25008 Transcript_8401/m.25008 type:complete len:343 (-) Transcript_8401:252-1280(-)
MRLPSYMRLSQSNSSSSPSPSPTALCIPDGMPPEPDANMDEKDRARSGNLALSIQSLDSPTSSLISQRSPWTCRNFSWLMLAIKAGLESTCWIMASMVSIGNCGRGPGGTSAAAAACGCGWAWPWPWPWTWPCPPPLACNSGTRPINPTRCGSAAWAGTAVAGLMPTWAPPTTPIPPTPPTPPTPIPTPIGWPWPWVAGGTAAAADTLSIEIELTSLWNDALRSEKWWLTAPSAIGPSAGGADATGEKTVSWVDPSDEPNDVTESDRSDENDEPLGEYGDDADLLPRFRRDLEPPSSARTASSIIQYDPLPGSSFDRGTRVNERFNDRLCRIEFFHPLPAVR